MLENAPLNVEVAYTFRGRDRFVHLVNYGGDKRIGGPQQYMGSARSMGFGFVCGAPPSRSECCSRRRISRLLSTGVTGGLRFRHNRSFSTAHI